MSVVSASGGDEARGYSATWAKFWAVTPRTIQRWRHAAARGEMPSPDAIDDMLRWSLGPERKPHAFLARVAEFRLKRERGIAARSAPAGASELGAAPPPTPPASPGYSDPDWAEFQASHSTAAPRDQASQIQDLETHLAFADFALRLARQRGDEHAQKKYADELIKFSKAVKEQKLLADKLGVESGELLPRALVENLLAAHAYWTMRATDRALDSLSRRLLNLSFSEEARAILEPELLSIRFVFAYTRATQIESPSALPAWLVDKLRDTVDDFIESGAAHFSAACGDHAEGSGI